MEKRHGQTGILDLSDSRLTPPFHFAHLLPQQFQVSMKFRLRQSINEGSKHLFIWFILLFALGPLYIVVAISFKNNKQFFNHPWLLTQPLHFENWERGWNQIGGTILNSIFISFTATVATLVFATLAGFFFARFRMPGKNLFWALYMTLFLMPHVINLIPLFSLLRSYHLLNTLFALIIVYTAGGQVICVYLLRGFIEDIPGDLFDAAQIDGASYMQQVTNIVVPMSMPILSTLAILRFIAAWNEFILALVVLRDESKFPIGVKLYQLEGAYLKEWGPLMATYAIASIPLIILFIFTMRHFVRGISAGAIKG